MRTLKTTLKQSEVNWFVTATNTHVCMPRKHNFGYFWIYFVRGKFRMKCNACRFRSLTQFSLIPLVFLFWTISLMTESEKLKKNWNLKNLCQSKSKTGNECHHYAYFRVVFFVRSLAVFVRCEFWWLKRNKNDHQRRQSDSWNFLSLPNSNNPRTNTI